MVSASRVGPARVKVPRGTAFGAVELVTVLGIPAMGDNAFSGGVSTADEGVYRTEVVSAFDPAALELEDENEFTAPGPVAPADAFDWINRLPRFAGSCCHCGAVSRIT